MLKIKNIKINSSSNFISNNLSSIQDIIMKLNKIEENFILLINSSNKFIGTVTDGDLRRALLNKDISITDSITKCMNTKPLTGKVNERKSNLAKLDKIDLQIPFLPIVDDNNHLVEVLISIKVIETIDTALILAGGKGTRLGELTKNTPKPLLKVEGRPILERILINLHEAQFKNVYISVHYLSEQFDNFLKDFSSNINITVLKEPFALGTAGSLKLLPTSINDNVLVMNGDILTKISLNNFISMHLKDRNHITIAAALNKIKINFGVIEYDTDFNFKGINEKPLITNFVNAGLYCLSKSVIGIIKKNQKIDMPELLELSKASGQKIGVFPMHEDWLDLGTLEDFQNASKK